MTTSANGTGSNTDSQTPPGMPTPAKAAPATEAPTDDFGYEEPGTPAPKADEPPKTDDNVDPPKTDDEPAKKDGEKTGLGYDDEDEVTPPEEKKPEEKKPDDAPKTDEEKAQAEISEVVKSLGDGYDKEKVLAFAKEHKLTKDQVAAYVKMQTEADQAALKAHETKVKEQRKQWKEELRNDKDFAGEKGDQFDKNVLKVNQLLDKFGPNIKKKLTESKGMLPPYLMKDFLAMAKALNPKQDFVSGEAPVVEETKDWMDDFYTT